MIKIEEIFNKRIEEYIESNKQDILKKINLTECKYLIENPDECVNSLIKQYTVNPITIDFNKIDYSEKKSKGYYQDGTVVENTIYTFNVSFEGNVELLSYRSNKGKYKDNTYFVENNNIYFKSLNFDLKPISKRFSNTVDILKSIIFNLNNEYETWNNNLPNFVKSHVKTRKEILIKFKEFCKKYKISEERIKKMKFQLNALEALSKIIGETYTGSEITRLFKKAGFPEIVHDGNTKWKFVCETFENMQEESIEGFYKILKVLEVLCDPQEYLLTPEKYEDNLKKVNRVLSFYGFEFNEEGILVKLEEINTKLETHSITSQEEKEHYDVFISHSSKDKVWVNELYKTLSETDLEIWYDIAILRIGDNLREKINNGLTKSDYGIVVLSKEFIKRSWPKMEFDALISLMDDGRLLPINHGLNDEDLEKFFKPLKQIRYMSTEEFTVKEISDEIYSKIKNG